MKNHLLPDTKNISSSTSSIRVSTHLTGGRIEDDTDRGSSSINTIIGEQLSLWDTIKDDSTLVWFLRSTGIYQLSL